MDLYKILGLTPAATDQEIRAAYCRLRSSAHPDKKGDASMFVQIQKAYDILSDPERRTDYDSTGNTEYKADSVVQTTIIEMVMSLINQLDVAVQDPLETAKRQTSQKCRLKPSALQVGGFLLMKGVNCPHVQTFQAIR